MLKKSILTGLAAAALAAGISFAAPVAASAGNLNIELRHHNGHGSIYIGKRKRHSNYHRPRRHKVCHPGRAIHKAERRGVRHARVKRVGNRFVVVNGRKRGSHIKMAFYRDSRHCELAWVKRTPRYKHGHGYVRKYRHGYSY